MPRTVNEAFEVFLERLVPTEAQRAAASTHRSSVETSLEKSLTVKRYRETGPFRHGTGVRNHADVDLLVSIGKRTADLPRHRPRMDPGRTEGELPQHVDLRTSTRGRRRLRWGR